MKAKPTHTIKTPKNLEIKIEFLLPTIARTIAKDIFNGGYDRVNKKEATRIAFMHPSPRGEYSSCGLCESALASWIHISLKKIFNIK